jgi:SNF2 family DNA or RNA helicase
MFPHQLALFTETRDLKSHAILWEPGLGKSKGAIDIFAYQFEKGAINAVLIVAPNGVHRNWISDELPKHLPDRVMAKTRTMFWQTKKSGTVKHKEDFVGLTLHDGLAVFCISYSAFVTKAGKAAVWKFMQRRDCFYIADEAHNFKTPKAQRTKSIVASGRYCKFKRILTGTPCEKPFDLYSQLRFLNPSFWRPYQMNSFEAFKQYFGVWEHKGPPKIEPGDPRYRRHMKQPGWDELLSYKNVDECADILATVSDRRLKEDVLDLPPKLYTKIHFDMTPKQKRMYEQLRDQYILELEAGDEDIDLALVRLLRMQQIACGYRSTGIDEPTEACDDTNPRLDAAVDYLQALPHQAIVWARFRQDIDQLVDALGANQCARYDGAVTDDECEQAKLAFNAGTKQFFVANPARGSEGITLNGAKTAMFYSNSFKLLQRIQAEDRCHRIGQDGTDHAEGFGVLYVDLLANNTVDEKIVESLRNKYDLAAQLTGDRFREWI